MDILSKTTRRRRPVSVSNTNEAQSDTNKNNKGKNIKSTSGLSVVSGLATQFSRRRRAASTGPVTPTVASIDVPTNPNKAKDNQPVSSSVSSSVSTNSILPTPMLASTSNTSNMSAKSFKRAMTDIFRRRASSQLDLTIAEDADTQPILLDASNELATEENNSSALINAVNEDTSTLDIDTFNAQSLRLSNESTDVVIAEADTSMLLEDEQTVKSDKQSGQKARFKQAGRQMRRLTKKFADGELLTLRNKLRTNRSSNETNTANLTKMGKDGEKATDTGYAIEEDIEENNNLIVEAEEENTNEEEHHVDSVLNSPTEQNIVAKETTITCKVVSNSENNDLVNDSPVSTEEDYNAVLPADNAVEDSKTPTEDADVTLNSKVGICTEETDASTASEILDALDITATDPISALPELTEDETGEKDIEESTKDNAADFYILEESQEPFAFVDGAQPVDDNDDGYDEAAMKDEVDDATSNEEEANDDDDTPPTTVHRHHRHRLSFLRTNSGTLKFSLAPTPALIRVHTEPAYKVRVYKKNTSPVMPIFAANLADNSNTGDANNDNTTSLDEVLDSLQVCTQQVNSQIG